MGLTVGLIDQYPRILTSKHCCLYKIVQQSLKLRITYPIFRKYRLIRLASIFKIRAIIPVYI